MKPVHFPLIFLFVLSLAASARADVRAAYLQGGGNTVTIRVEVTKPAPAATIVLQRFPAGVRLLSADPSPADVEPTTGTARWFFKRIRPGRNTISMHLSRPVSPKELSGIIRYHEPGTGKMVRVTIR